MVSDLDGGAAVDLDEVHSGGSRIAAFEGSGGAPEAARVGGAGASSGAVARAVAARLHLDADELGSVQGEEVELGLGELPAAAEDVESTALEVAGGEK